jgi:hypothetical protein
MAGEHDRNMAMGELDYLVISYAGWQHRAGRKTALCVGTFYIFT